MNAERRRIATIEYTKRNKRGGCKRENKVERMNNLVIDIGKYLSLVV